MSADIFSWLNSHVKVSCETFDRLAAYHDLLVKWQTKINLVGPDTLTDAWRRHFLDSLQLLPMISDLSQRGVDLGTGAGFPGMVLAVCGATDMHLVESDTKKVAFLKEVARVTQTSVVIHHQRIESCKIDDVTWIVSRACSPLVTLLEYSLPLVSHETTCLFHKGKNYSIECEEATKRWSFDATVTPSLVDEQSVIMRIGHLHIK